MVASAPRSRACPCRGEVAGEVVTLRSSSSLRAIAGPRRRRRAPRPRGSLALRFEQRLPRPTSTSLRRSGRRHLLRDVASSHARETAPHDGVRPRAGVVEDVVAASAPTASEVASEAVVLDFDGPASKRSRASCDQASCHSPSPQACSAMSRWTAAASRPTSHAPPSRACSSSPPPASNPWRPQVDSHATARARSVLPTAVPRSARVLEDHVLELVALERRS